MRTQNCNLTVGGSCAHCSGSGEAASILTFSELLQGGWLETKQKNSDPKEQRARPLSSATSAPVVSFTDPRAHSMSMGRKIREYVHPSNVVVDIQRSLTIPTLGCTTFSTPPMGRTMFFFPKPRHRTQPQPMDGLVMVRCFPTCQAPSPVRLFSSLLFLNATRCFVDSRERPALPSLGRHSDSHRELNQSDDLG